MKMLCNGLISSLFLLALFFIPNEVVAFDFYDWSNGVSGYEEAINEAMDEDKPLVLYFHTDWCKWCKKLNATYLDAYDVSDFLSEIPKVEINPEQGRAENRLANKYKVTGYPSFFVSVPSIDSRIERIYPFTKKGEWTTDEFIQAIRQKIVIFYNREGYSRYKLKQYDEAVRYYEMTTGFDPEDAYAYYGKAIVYQTAAFENEDTSLLEAAEENYLRALEIDPDHAGSKKELKRLQKMMKKMGI